MTTAPINPSKPRQIDVTLLLLGIAMVVSTFTPLVRIMLFSAVALDAWWGFIVLAAGLVTATYAATQVWPEFGRSLPGLRLRQVALVGSIGAFAVFSYVGIRLADVSRQLNKITDTEQESVDSTNVLGEDFTQAFEDFADSLKDALQPTLGYGWYVGMISSAGSGIVLARRKPVSPAVHSSGHGSVVD